MIARTTTEGPEGEQDGGRGPGHAGGITLGVAMIQDDALCICGHPYRAHRHLRRGTDCALCGAAVCPRFRRPRWWRR